MFGNEPAGELTTDVLLGYIARGSIGGNSAVSAIASFTSPAAQPEPALNPHSLAAYVESGYQPLAKRLESDPERVERFQLLAGGTELTNGFSELNDPDDQRARFTEQAALRDAGDAEAMRLDEDYLEAMEHGMPPTAGIGFGDRVFATLVDKPIRETVLFPLVRPK